MVLEGPDAKQQRRKMKGLGSECQVANKRGGPHVAAVAQRAFFWKPARPCLLLARRQLGRLASSACLSRRGQGRGRCSLRGGERNPARVPAVATMIER